MKLKALVPMAGADVAYRPGDVFEADEAEASRLIAAEHAESAEDAAPEAPKKAKK